MRKTFFIIIFITLFNFGCSKLRNDAALMICTSLETNPNLCSETIARNY